MKWSGAAIQASDAPAGLGEFRRGWPVLVGALLGVAVGLTGLPFYSFGIFLKPLAAEFGWSRSAIGTGMLCISAGTVLGGPLLGPVIDRIGVRRLATLSLLGLACGFVLLSRIGPNIATFYGAWLVATALGSATTPLTWTRAVSLRFTQRRGLALGMMLLGTGVSGILAPPLLQQAIAAYGWRGAYLAIAAFIALIVAPLVWRALRGCDDQRLIATVARTGLSRGEALRTRHFWTIALSILAVTIAQAAITVHLPAMLADNGFAPGAIAGVLSLLGLSIVAGRILVGYAMDKLHPPFVAGLFFALPIVSLVLLLHAPTLGAVYAAAILLGLAGGAEVDLLSFLVGRFFGLRAYGAIYGLALSFFGIGAGTGPLLTGLMFDHYHAYQPAMLWGIALYGGGAALVATLGKTRF